MNIETTSDGQVTVVTISGRLDATTAPAAESALNAAIEDGAVRLVAHLADLDYISSAGLRVLLATAKALSRKDGCIVLSALQPGVREVFDISGLLSIFAVADTVEAARALALE